MPLRPMLPERRAEQSLRPKAVATRQETPTPPRRVLQSGCAPAQLSLFLRPSGAP